jgi:hypothetical protein
VVAGVAVLMPAAAQARVRVSMKPGSGRPTTRFTVSFRTPNRTGRFGSIHRTDVLRAMGPQARGGCVSRLSTTLAPTRKGRRVRVKLNPRSFGGAWCVGRFHGSVVEHQSTLCPVGPQLACPLVVIRPRTIARFSFLVKAPPPGTGGGHNQTEGPTFAGIVSAAGCTSLIPRVEPRVRNYRLMWDAGTDPETPSSQIVYDVYFSSTPGGESFAQPSWTSGPGATGLTVSVPGTGPAYFVVRARDQAGLEDRNTVERQGVNQCG